MQLRGRTGVLTGSVAGLVMAVSDVASSAQRLARVERARAALGPRDALGNNAGVDTVKLFGNPAALT